MAEFDYSQYDNGDDYTTVDAIYDMLHRADNTSRPMSILLECYNKYENHTSEADRVANDKEALDWLDDYWEYVCSVEHGNQASIEEIGGFIGMAETITNPEIAGQVIDYLQYDDEIDEDAQNLIDRLKQITSRYNGVNKMKKSIDIEQLAQDVTDLYEDIDPYGRRDAFDTVEEAYYANLEALMYWSSDEIQSAIIDNLQEYADEGYEGDGNLSIQEVIGRLKEYIRINKSTKKMKKSIDEDAVFNFIKDSNSCCYGEIYDYCKDIGMSDQQIDDAISNLESTGKIEFVNQMDYVVKSSKKMKKSSMKSNIKNLRNCLLDLATYFYNLNPGSKTDDVCNEITRISDELYYIMDDLSIDKGKIILVDGEIYEIPDSIEDKIKLAQEICYSIENEMNIGDYDDIRERLNESLNKIKYLLHHLEDTESKSTKKSIPSIHDMIAQTRANNNSLVKSRVDLKKEFLTNDLDRYDDIGYMAEACANEMDSVFKAINETSTENLEFRCSPDEYYQKLLECKKNIDWLVDNINVWVR